MPSHVGQVIMSTTLDTAAKVRAIYGGTWEAWGAGRVPVGVNTSDTDFNAPNKTGGSKTVTLTLNQIPAHGHKLNTWAVVMNKNYVSAGDRIGTNTGGGQASAKHNATKNDDDYISDNAGGGQAHTNLQPYQTLYMWKRTA